jgi:ATP sulfurylase
MTDIYEDIRIVVQRHREQAAKQERAKIVAWLKDNPDHLAHKGWLAAQIEAKEHLK